MQRARTSDSPPPSCQTTHARAVLVHVHVRAPPAARPQRPPAVLAPAAEPGPEHLGVPALALVVLPGHDQVRRLLQHVDAAPVALAQPVALADRHVLQRHPGVAVAREGVARLVHDRAVVVGPEDDPPCWISKLRSLPASMFSARMSIELVAVGPLLVEVAHGMADLVDHAARREAVAHGAADRLAATTPLVPAPASASDVLVRPSRGIASRHPDADPWRGRAPDRAPRAAAAGAQAAEPVARRRLQRLGRALIPAGLPAEV